MNQPILEFGIPLICLMLVLLMLRNKEIGPAPTIPIDQLRAQLQASGILILIKINLGFTLLEVDQDLVSYYFL